MPYGLYLSAEGAQAQVMRMEVIANNLANVNTPGFKQDLAVFQARDAEAVEQDLTTGGTGSIEDIGGGVEMVGVQTDFAPGKMQQTGMPTDMAIVGEGFFQVRKGDQTFLTRAGNFSFDTSGQLSTPEGYPVLSQEGVPITINQTLGNWTMTPSGGVQQGDATTLLGMVRPASLGDLAKVGENLFSPLAETQPVPAEERNVRLGVLEMSGVNPTGAMMEMIDTSRAIEANLKLVQHQDEMLDALISRVLQG